MKVKVIEVKFNFFGKNDQIILKDDYIDLKVMPVKGDRVIIDDVKYIVLQRDIYMRKDTNNQHVTLFVERNY